MKKFIKKGIPLLLFLLFFTGCGTTTENEKENTPVNQEVEVVQEGTEAVSSKELAEAFILEVYSDFPSNPEKISEYVDENNTALREFIKDRKEIRSLMEELNGRELSLEKYAIKDQQSRSFGEGQKEELLTIAYDYLDGGAPSYGEFICKVIVDEEKGKILAAMSEDLSSNKLLGNLAKSYEELNLEYQLEENSQKPYNLEEQKERLKEMQKEYQDPEEGTKE